VSYALTVLLMLVVWWSAAPGRPVWGGVSVATVAATVINPISWFYGLVVLILPGAHVLAYLKARCWPRGPTWCAIGIALWLSLPVVSIWVALGSLNRLLGLGAMASALACLAFVAAMLQRNTRS
jgi:hypothetical protein